MRMLKTKNKSAKRRIRLASISSSEPSSSSHDLEMDRDTLLYDPENNQMMSFMTMLPLLRAISLQDKSSIRWCYSWFPNLSLVSQNFSKCLVILTLLIYNEPFYPAYHSFSLISISCLTVSHSSVASLFNLFEEVVGSPSTLFEQPSFVDHLNSLFPDSQHSANTKQNTISSVIEYLRSTNVLIAFDPPIVKSQNSTINNHNIVSHTITHVPIHSSFSTSIMKQESNPPNLLDIPSSSQTIIPQL